MRTVLKQHLIYCNTERNHQSLVGNRKPLLSPHEDFFHTLEKLLSLLRLQIRHELWADGHLHWLRFHLLLRVDRDSHTSYYD